MSFFRSQVYSAADNDDDEESEMLEKHASSVPQVHIHSPIQHLPLTIVLTGVIIIVTIALAITVTSYASALRLAPLKENTAKAPPSSCGSSLSEAAANRCFWDELTKTWLPPSCPAIYNVEYKESANGTWKYWSDKHRSHEIKDIASIAVDDSQFATSPGGLGQHRDTDWYTTTGEHSAHCAFVVLRHVHALNFGAPMDGITAEWAHIEHCIFFLLEKATQSPLNDLVTVRAWSAFGKCHDS